MKSLHQLDLENLEASRVGVAATGRERDARRPVIRRVGGFCPLLSVTASEAIPRQFHFDFYDASGSLVMSSERQRKLPRPVPHHPPIGTARRWTGGWRQRSASRWTPSRAAKGTAVGPRPPSALGHGRPPRSALALQVTLRRRRAPCRSATTWFVPVSVSGALGPAMSRCAQRPPVNSAGRAQRRWLRPWGACSTHGRGRPPVESSRGGSHPRAGRATSAPQRLARRPARPPWSLLVGAEQRADGPAQGEGRRTGESPSISTSGSSWLSAYARASARTIRPRHRCSISTVVPPYCVTTSPDGRPSRSPRSRRAAAGR